MVAQVCVKTYVDVDTAPTTEPVTTDEAKTHLRIEHAHEDAYIDTLIAAAREYCETKTRLHFIDTVLKQYHDVFPDTLELRHPPVNTFTSIEYYDTADALQTFAASKYNTDLASRPARVWLDDGESWPSTYLKPNAVVLTYTSGYGSAASSVPDVVKTAVKMLVHHWYFSARAPVITGSVPMMIQMSVDSMLGSVAWSAIP